jgi:hypothetical protein
VVNSIRAGGRKVSISAHLELTLDGRSEPLVLPLCRDSRQSTGLLCDLVPWYAAKSTDLGRLTDSIRPNLPDLSSAESHPGPPLRHQERHHLYLHVAESCSKRHWQFCRYSWSWFQVAQRQGELERQESQDQAGGVGSRWCLPILAGRDEAKDCWWGQERRS